MHFLLWNVIKCFALWNLIFVYLRLITHYIVLIAKHTVHLVLGIGVWVFKKILKICSVKLFIPLFLQILIRTRFGVIMNLHYFHICFVWYEGFVKLCSKLCVFVNTIIFWISCVNFVVYFGDSDMNRRESFPLGFFFLPLPRWGFFLFF